MRYIFIILSVLLVSSCSPVRVGPETSYIINALPESIHKKSNDTISLLVTEAEGDPVYNSKEMIYSTHPLKLAFFAKNGWADTPMHMLKPLLAQALQNTHYFSAVSFYPAPGRYDYMLNIQLVELRQVFSVHESFVHLTLQAQLVNSHNNKVVSSQRFSDVERSPEYSPYGGVIATNQAVKRVLGQLTQFCLNNI